MSSRLESSSLASPSGWLPLLVALMYYNMSVLYLIYIVSISCVNVVSFRVLVPGQSQWVVAAPRGPHVLLLYYILYILYLYHVLMSSPVESSSLESPSGWLPLLVALMFEYNDPASRWKPYFTLVPDFSQLDPPMFWDR